MITFPDFSVQHTTFLSLCKEDPLGFTIHHPELIVLKNIKSYRDWSALKQVYHTELKKNIFVFHIKIHEISPGAIQKSNGLKVTCLASLYFKSEDTTMKNLIFLGLSGFLHIFTNKFPWLFHDFCDNFHDLISHYFTIRIKICSSCHSMLTKMNDY